MLRVRVEALAMLQPRSRLDEPEREAASPAGVAGRAEPRTPALERVYRVVRAIVHLGEGLATLVLVFPSAPRERRLALIRAWSARLLRIFAIETRIEGEPPHVGEPGLMLVANHVSWVDIFVIHAMAPSRFIAKAELKRWPFIGWLIAGVGTLFIERGDRRHMHEVNEVVREALRAGDLVAVFPEGATGDGAELRPFHGSLLQPVVEVGGVVKPLALRYRSANGEPTLVVAYVDVSFLHSVWRIAGTRRLLVEARFAPAIGAADRHRREVVREAEAAIRARLA